MGAIFIFLAFIDNWAFIFHPFLANIVIDIKSRRDEDRRELEKVANNDTNLILTLIETNSNNNVIRNSSLHTQSIYTSNQPSFISGA